jgi:hypothetical protein
VRANLDTNLDVSRMSIERILAAGGAKLFSHVTAAAPLGNTGRNILRHDLLSRLRFAEEASRPTRIEWPPSARPDKRESKRFLRHSATLEGSKPPTKRESCQCSRTLKM